MTKPITMNRGCAWGRKLKGAHVTTPRVALALVSVAADVLSFYRVDEERVRRPPPRDAAPEVQRPDEREREHGCRQQLRGHHHRQRGHPEAGAALHWHRGAPPPHPPPRRLRDRYHHHSRLPLHLRVAAARWHISIPRCLRLFCCDLVADPR
jgi:hypothetical protein